MIIWPSHGFDTLQHAILMHRRVTRMWEMRGKISPRILYNRMGQNLNYCPYVEEMKKKLLSEQYIQTLITTEITNEVTKSRIRLNCYKNKR